MFINLCNVWQGMDGGDLGVGWGWGEGVVGWGMLGIRWGD